MRVPPYLPFKCGFLVYNFKITDYCTGTGLRETSHLGPPPLRPTREFLDLSGGPSPPPTPSPNPTVVKEGKPRGAKEIKDVRISECSGGFRGGSQGGAPLLFFLKI